MNEEECPTDQTDSQMTAGATTPALPLKQSAMRQSASRWRATCNAERSSSASGPGAGLLHTIDDDGEEMGGMEMDGAGDGMEAEMKSGWVVFSEC